MKELIFIVSLGCFFHEVICAQVIDKKITIKATNMTIENLLDQLSTDHDISFSYCKDYLALDAQITIDRKNTSIRGVLDEILFGQPIKYKMIGNLIVFKKTEVLAANDEIEKDHNMDLTSSQSESDTIAEMIIAFPVQLDLLKRIPDFQFSSINDPSIIIPTTLLNRKQRTSPEYLVVKSASLVSTASRDEMDFRMPKMIVQRAFEHVESNFLLKPHLFNGYYREIYEEDKRAISIVEANVNIYDRGYRMVKDKSKKPREKVALRSVRASRNYMQNEFKPDFEQFNSLSAMLSWNKIKYRDPDMEVNLGKTEYKLDSTLRSPTGITYVVSTSYSFRHQNRTTTYYIDAMTHVFLKVKYEQKADEGYYLDHQWRFSKDRNYYFKAKQTQMVYNFKNHNGKMYLSRCIENSSADIYSPWNQSVEWEFGCSRVLIITDVENINNKNTTAMNVNKSLAQQTTEYHSEDWAYDERLNLTPLVQEQVEDLELELPLEEQYQENALASKNQ